MKRKILLIMLCGFILFGCGDISKIRVLSIGKPYLVGVEELCKEQYEKDINCSSDHFFYPDNEESKTKVIAVPIKTTFSMIQNAGYVIRECSFTEKFIKSSEHGFDVTAFPFERNSDKKGFFVLNIDKFKRLGWLNKDNLLTKSICVSPPFGSKYYKEKHEIDPIALKKALDEMDAQEDEK